MMIRLPDAREYPDAVADVSPVSSDARHLQHLVEDAGVRRLADHLLEKQASLPRS
jgi:hypothetical protein